jgi:hypothetical protein
MIPTTFYNPSPKRHRPDDASTITTATPSSDATSNYYASLQDNDDDDTDLLDATNADPSLEFDPSIYATPPTTPLGSPHTSHPHDKHDEDAMSTSSPVDHLQEHKADLSQDAMASFTTSEVYVIRNHPNRHDEFVTMLTDSISHNKDPALLATIVRGWPAHQP